MRFVVFLLGLVLGVAGTLAYVIFLGADRPRIPPPAPPPSADAPITVILGEPFLSGVVRQAIRETPAISAVDPADVIVHAQDGQLVIDAQIDMLGQHARGTARLRPVLQAGELRVEVIDTSVGSLPLPPLAAAIEQQLNARLRSFFTGMPVSVTGLRVDRVRGLILTCKLDAAQLSTAW